MRLGAPSVAALALLAAACGGSTSSDRGAAGSLDVEVLPADPVASTFVRGSGLPPVKSVPFALGDLPTFVLEGADAKSRVSERVALDVLVSRDGGSATVRVAPQQGRVSWLAFDGRGAWGRTGVRVRCGEWAAARLEVELLDIATDGGATFTRVTGIFDDHRCEAVERSRVTLKPLALVPGYLFAFRTCEEATCTSGTQQVTLLTPPMANLEVEGSGASPSEAATGFGRRTIPIVRGGAASMTGVVDQAVFTPIFGHPPAWSTGGPMLVGLDLVSSTSEAEPVAVAFFGRVTKPPTSTGSVDDVVFEHPIPED